MKRSWPLWICLPVCLATLCVAMGWVSLVVVRLDRTQREASRQAVVEEHARLALWRIDSALAPLVAQESVRPFLAYRSLNLAEPLQGGIGRATLAETMAVSPLATGTVPGALAHFQIEPDGRLTSPQDLPTAVIADLTTVLHRNRLLAALPPGRADPIIGIAIH